MNHIVTTKVWVFCLEEPDELLEVDLDIDVDIDCDGALVEGYSIYGKSVQLSSLRKHNPRIDEQIDKAVYNYLSNLPEGEEYEPELD